MKTSTDYATIYSEMHANPKILQGVVTVLYADEIAELVAQYKPARLLDYGSGKGHQYLVKRIHERWGGLLPHCYDVGVHGLSEPPLGPFGGVICTDVMEHIEEADVPIILDHVLSYVGNDGFAFFSISCRLAKKHLPDGRNAHLTVKPPRWWDAQIELAIQKNGRPLMVHTAYENQP